MTAIPPVRRHAPIRHPGSVPRGRRRAAAIIAAVAAVVLGATLVGMGMSGTPRADHLETLLGQMRAAAAGTVEPVHAFGGTLSAMRGNGRTNVIAEGLPSRICVQAGWRLAREGTVIVDGVLPARLSAARLSELCAGDGAILTWVPHE
jgi:hypothetical protein